MIHLIFSFLLDLYPRLVDGCPLRDPVSIEAWDLNEIAKQFMPPIMPEGTFMSFTRMHNTKNLTYVTAEFRFEIKAVGMSEMIKLG